VRRPIGRGVSATTDRTTAELAGGAAEPLAPAEGLDLLGEVSGSGYEQGAALVRRADGQMVQLGPLMYALLEEVDGSRRNDELSTAMCEKLGRECDESHVAAIARKLAQQGLLAGSESNTPERVNPLLALRWKFVVTNPELTRRLTAPFTWLFRPWTVVPVLVAFAVTSWFVVVHEGVASGAAQAFERPELILLIFALGVASAAFHELGHASACRVGGGTPGAMGAGIYLVWPAFYTDVTDAYRLPRGARLRTDLGGLYFNSIVAVATLGAWVAFRVDALLLLIALQLLEMVKQLSPVIRADGYHVLSDATGVPDLYAHIIPTLKRLLPRHRTEPSALTGRARVWVTIWVLVIVPVLLAGVLSAILLLPRLAASTWFSSGHVLSAMPGQAHEGDVVDLLVSLLRLLALTLPVMGMALITRRVVAGLGGRAVSWSRGRPTRRAAVVVVMAGVTTALAATWWPSGQYRPIHASDRGTIRDVGGLVASTPVSARSAAPVVAAASPTIAPGTHLAVSLIPEGGATKADPAIFVISDPNDHGAPIIIASDSAPSPDADSTTQGDPSSTTTATAFDFDLPDAPRANDSQALSVNHTDGGSTYTVAYSLVTVHDGDPVDETNGAYAFANCDACTTVAVSFQVVLIVGSSRVVTPVNIAEALNANCPSCVTTAIADQIVVSIGSEPSDDLLQQLHDELERLDAINQLGPDATPEDILTQVDDVQHDIDQLLDDSGLLPEAQATDDATATTPDDATTTTATDTTSDPGTTTDTTATDTTSTDPSTTTTTTTTSPTDTTTSTQ
jgi:putative peptide zinc metalloprotease protein